ncbi:MAG: FkbM family methyltransferase [Clostridiales bacterium]|nr:FkbM family methyltransferase [Clostridiales bacterium]
MLNQLKNKLIIIENHLKLPHKPEVICKKVRHGSIYAGYSICTDNLNPNCIVYSFGVGEDISFDLSIIESYGVHVYAFDPTPKSIAWIRNQILPENYHFLPYGIADYDGYANFNPPANPLHVSHTMLDRPSTADKAIKVEVHTLSTIKKMLGHSNIDVAKMDIEGAEYAVLENILESDINVNQYLIEFHHRFENVGVRATQKAIKLLRNKGYKIFDVSPTFEEYSFIKV